MMTLPPSGMHSLPQLCVAASPRRHGRSVISTTADRGDRLALRPDERLDLGIGLGLSAAAVENAIMADFELEVVGLMAFSTAAAGRPRPIPRSSRSSGRKASRSPRSAVVEMTERPWRRGLAATQS